MLRVTVEPLILKMGSGADVVDDPEKRLAGLRIEPGPPADDLFELDHRAHGLEEDHKAQILNIDAGGQHLRRRRHNGRW